MTNVNQRPLQQPCGALSAFASRSLVVHYMLRARQSSRGASHVAFAPRVQLVPYNREQDSRKRDQSKIHPVCYYGLQAEHIAPIAKVKHWLRDQGEYEGLTRIGRNAVMLQVIVHECEFSSIFKQKG